MPSTSHRLAGALGLGALTSLGLACPATEFHYEGPGQPGDRASGVPPEGTIAACRVPHAKKPPLVGQSLWDNLKPCNRKTPRRYLRVGYGHETEPADSEPDRRMASMMEALRTSVDQKDGNVRMLTLLRAVRAQAERDLGLKARLERMSNRTFACDYNYVFLTTEREYQKRTPPDPCPAYVYAPKLREDQCLFDTNLREARWVTSAWSCMAFTLTRGEGESCHRLCAFDDFCAAQVGCAAADFDLLLCALGVCLPEKVAGFF
jgi:hypothetical protein